MIKLEIIEIDNYEYSLKDKDNNQYKLNIEFQIDNIQPQVGDYIYLSKNMLSKNYKEYPNVYTFGLLNSEYGKNIENDNESDIIRLDTHNQTIYLKRLYG